MSLKVKLLTCFYKYNDMKAKKLYFCHQIDEELCCTLEHFLEEMKERNLTEIKVARARRQTKSPYYFCKAIGECGIKPPEGEPCGSNCCDYQPRNGKSGCCKHYGYVYEPDDNESILDIKGNLSAITHPCKQCGWPNNLVDSDFCKKCQAESSGDVKAS